MSDNKTHFKRETQGAFCALNGNAKSQTRKSMKINVICTVDRRMRLSSAGVVLCMYIVYSTWYGPISRGYSLCHPSLDLIYG